MGQTLSAMREAGGGRAERRVGRAAAALLDRYWKKFQWQPRAVVVMGGAGAGMNLDAVKAELDTRWTQRDGHSSPLVLGFESRDAAAEAQLEGALVYADTTRYTVRVHV